MTRMRFRNIVFTLNNYTDDEYNNLLNHKEFKYVIIGKEIGEKGTPHLQGYAELNRQLDLNKVKEINARMHFERRRGSQKQAIEYCKKDNVYECKGMYRVQGQRVDLQKVREDIKNGISMSSILEGDIPTSSELRVIDRMFSYLSPKKRISKPEVHWYYGSTGTGKSRTAMSVSEDYYVKDSTKWWDGYDNQDTVIIDDFRAKNMKFNDLLRLLDWMPYRLEIKGGTRWLHSRRIIITTPRHPRATYSRIGEDINQLLRRIDVLRDFDTMAQVSQNVGNTVSDTFCEILKDCDI